MANLFSSKDEVVFSSIEKYVYDSDFKLLFTEEEFKMFISIAEMKKRKEKGSLAQEGEIIDKVIYIARIPEYKSLTLKAKDMLISYLHEGSWLGKSRVK